MPSSVIVGALVLAWLVVLVPMIARKRQEVARTADSALAARVVRSGTVHRRTEEVRAMADAGTDKELRGRQRSVTAARASRRVTSKYYDDYDYYETDGYPELDDAYLAGAATDRDDDLDEVDDRDGLAEADARPARAERRRPDERDRAEEHDEHPDDAPGTGRRADDEHPDDELADDERVDEPDDERDADDEYDDSYDDDDEDDEYTDELPLPEEHEPGDNYREPAGHRTRAREFRPGRGGFDPEAAELSKQAKYAFRRRVVLGMFVAVVGTALVAAIVLQPLWWATLVIALALTGYLVYLRRQVRMEEEIRQRRLSRMRATGWTVPEHEDDDEFDEELTERRRVEADTAHDMLPDFHDETPPRRRVSVSPPPSVPGAAVLDVDDDDPAFDDLAQPGSLPYRKAAGE